MPLGRMSASLMPRSASRGHARGRDFLRVVVLCRGLSARWLEFVNAPRRKQPTQARVAGDAEMKCQRRDKAPAARRWRLDIATQTPQHCRASSSESLLWRFDAAALVHWRLGIGSIVALARRRCCAGE